MKEKIHPKYFPDAKITCLCGNTFTSGSTKPQLKVEVCSKCHPYFTGAQRLMDVEGRVERFMRRYGKKLEKTEKPEATKEAEK